jgi:ABC-2 type transport system ATP-binding protein
MKRQSIVIVALACNTDYLLLDEAFGGLDPAMRLIVKKMVYDSMLDRELTLVISSHNLGELNELCDSVAMIHKGKVLFEKELDSVKGDVHKIQLVFKNVEYTKDNFRNLQILHFDRTGSIYNLIVKGTEEEINAEIQPKNPLAFEILPLTLEEIFIYELEVLGYDSSGIQTAVEQ